jgi:hypothetical protein
MGYPAWMDEPAWGEAHVKDHISMTLPPGESIPENSFFDGMLFIDTLTLAIALKDDGEMLLSELRKKWPSEVDAYMAEAEAQALLDIQAIKEAG